MENLLEDPDFNDDNSLIESDDEEHQNESCYLSKINYDQFETQEPILDDLDFSAYNTGTYDKLNSNNEDKDDTYQLFFEIRIESGKGRAEFLNSVSPIKTQ